MSAHMCILCVLAGMLVTVASGCERRVASRERREAQALVDSVAALPDVRSFAQKELSDARVAIATGDSLLQAGQVHLARASFAEAVVYARLAVVVAEQARAEQEALSAPAARSP